MTGIEIAKITTKLAFDIAFPILEAIEKDGYQNSDLIAFIGSEDFKNDISALIKSVVNKPTPPSAI